MKEKQKCATINMEKKMTKLYFSIILSIVLFLLLECLPQKNIEKIQVAVSILPQKYFVERIAGNYVKVNVIVQPGKSPATFKPAPQQILDLANSQVYFRIGVPFEKAFMPKIEQTLPALPVIDTSKGIELRMFEDQRGKDPHIWLKPLNVKKQARIILDTLISLDPLHQQDYKKNYKAFVNDLDVVHQKLTDILKPVKGRMLFVFHPAYGYFADAYGLEQVAITAWGRSPGPAYLEQVVEQAYKQGVKVIFVQPQFDQKSALAVAQVIKGVVVPLDPLAPDYLENLERMAHNIVKALKDN